MNKIKEFCRTIDWNEIGIVAFYGYFAINILMKAFAYNHGDGIYKYFFAFTMIFWAIKMVTTKYTLRETIWICILMGAGLGLSVYTKQNTWLLLFMTMVAMKNCTFLNMVKIDVYIRTFCMLILTVGSIFGAYDIGKTVTVDTKYVEIDVYSFGLVEPNTAFLTLFITINILLYYNYEKLNWKWFVATTAIAIGFYEFTFCRTGIAVFFFNWLLIIFEKLIKNHRVKIILALSVPVGTIFSFITMLVYNASNPLMKLMNHLVSGRIYIMNSYFKDQGISFLPRTQEIFYASYHGLIDNTYMFVFLYCGVIVALLFLAAVCWNLFRLYRGRYYKELVMIGCMALYAVLEQFVMNGFMNIYILLCAASLYPGIMDGMKPSQD